MPPDDIFFTLEAVNRHIDALSGVDDVVDLRIASNYTVDGRPDRRIGKVSTGIVHIVSQMLSQDYRGELCEQHERFRLFRFRKIRFTIAAEQPFPPDFAPQPIRLPNADQLLKLPQNELVSFFAAHPDASTALLGESGDKRWMPSTFVSKGRNGYRVGWAGSEDPRLSCVQDFVALEEAATDYLLFSLGKGRWKPG